MIKDNNRILSLIDSSLLETLWEINVFVFDLTFAEENYAELVAAYDCAFIHWVILSVQHFLVKIEDLRREVLVSVLLALIKFGGFCFQWVRVALHILHIVELDLDVLVGGFWV